MLRFLSPIHKATRQISLWFEQRMGEVGVSPQEGHVLSYLRSYAPCPISELSRVFGLKPSTLTSLLDRLEEGGWVAREANPADRRSVMVGLTPEGKKLANRVQRLVDEIETGIGARVTDTDLAGFNRVMGALGEFTGVEVRKPQPG